MKNGSMKTRVWRKSLLISLTATIFIFSMPSLFAKDEVKSAVKENLKKIKEEAKSFGKEKNKEAKAILESFFSGEKLSMNSEELLPEEEKGKTFDSDLAAEKTDKQEILPSGHKLQEMIELSQKSEDIEGSEEFLVPSRITLETSKTIIGIASEEQIIIPEEKNIESCLAGGSFIKTIDKTRQITIIPRKTEEIKTCLGHQKTKEFFWESDAKQQGRNWEDAFFGDFSLKNWDVEIVSGGIFESYHVAKTWTHKDEVLCDQNHFETKILQEEKVVDQWEPDNSQKEMLSVLEANIDCELLQTQEFNSGIRTISDRSIYRDSWNQRLIFSCNPGPNSKCKRLQEQGGVLIKKTCLQEDEFGDCFIWEKTYDLGGKALYMTQEVAFEDDQLFDLEDFDPSYEKNSEFGQVISIFSSLENVGESISEEGFDPDNPSIFSGRSSKCRRSFDSKNLFDCCHKRDCEGRGIFIGLDLGRCSKEERNLFEKIQEGKCHRIGHIKKLLMTEHVYCCFPTKLSRIIQEEGHKQLGISWGKPEEPNCLGLTLAQLQSLDFEQMDFSDFVEELQDKIDSKKLAKHLKTMSEGFSNAFSEEQAKAKTDEKLEIPREKIKSNGGFR